MFANHHAPDLSAYLVDCLVPHDVNCLVPHERDIRVTGQKRNFVQSVYQVDYVVQSSGPEEWSIPWSASPLWMGAVALLLTTPFALLWWAGKRHRYGQ